MGSGYDWHPQKRSKSPTKPWRTSKLDPFFEKLGGTEIEGEIMGELQFFVVVDASRNEL